MDNSSFIRVTVKQVAIKHKKSELTVRRWIKKGKIKAEKDMGGHDWIIYVKKKEKNKYGF